ncbi:hypothetical protein [Candidatus Regiella endosymbiont of Tuberolachnus salignus]|uniref:hypothetical protein n=1 Tax=Candidatus Regiella endosymbiont of Tuberolachnus salignus TaxID=3077956 RepID=UPI0030D27547
MTQNNDWQHPVPIDEQSTAAEYPLDALPTLIRNAVSAYHCYGQQPIPLIASSALANISLACQAHARPCWGY